MKDDKTETENSKALWSGRFSEATEGLVQNYTRSIHFDQRLVSYDLRGSSAHVRMLATQGILRQQDAETILEGLKQIEEELRNGTFPFRDELEDIHMNIEKRLTELVGEVGGRLHSGRSRNDQIAVDLKLYCQDVCQNWQNLLGEAISILVERARERKSDLFPGWTHLQAAQPVAWGHYLLAFAEMFFRDFTRLKNWEMLHSVSPLGAGALSGSSMPLDPSQTARELGFESNFRNSYDVVGDRDFLLELSQISCQLMIHLSRLSEDLIYMTSTPVSWIELPDRLCTGSSMMPQKKNPDVLELMRGKTASVIGHSNALTTLLKGLPSSYHRDLQQDKEHLFPIVDIVSESLEILHLLLEGFSIHQEKVDEALAQGFLLATDIAEMLVEKGVPFREAHEKVGKLVSFCHSEGVSLDEVSDSIWFELVPELADSREALNIESVLSRRTHSGSTGLKSIEEQLVYWVEWIEERKRC